MIKQNSLEFLTSDQSIKQNNDYIVISEVLTDMVKSGAVALGTGYCITMSEMIHVALKHKNIKSKLVECTLTLSYLEENVTKFIGFDNIKNPGEIDTHVVVITETTPSYIIDASIANRFNSPPNIILDSCKSIAKSSSVLADLEFSNHKVKATYVEKPIQKVADMHQTSILNRIETDKKIFKNLKILKILIAVALTVTTVNGIRGLYDFYNIYVAENRMGPISTQDIQERVENIERLIIKNLKTN